MAEQRRRSVCGWPVRDAPTLAEQLLAEAPALWVRMSDGRLSAEQARAELARLRAQPRRPSGGEQREAKR